MNFAQNQWSATLDGASIVNSQSMTTRGAQLDLGDVDAVWVIHKPGAPGNNFLLFDNYVVTADSGSSVPAPRLQILSRPANGKVNLRLSGVPAQRYVLEASTNLVNWSAIHTNTGNFEFSDSVAGMPLRFYRAHTQ